MKTYFVTEGTPIKKQDPGDIARQTAFENMPGFGTGIGVGVYNIGNIIKDLITDKEERQETLEVLQNSVQNVPYRLYNVFANQLPTLAVDISETIFDATREVPILKEVQDRLIIGDDKEDLTWLLK